MSMLTEEQLDLLFQEIVSYFLEEVNKEIHEVYNECDTYLQKFDYIGNLADISKYDFYHNWRKFSDISRDKRLNLIFEEVMPCVLKYFNNHVHKEYNECDAYRKKLDYITDLAKTVNYEIDKSNFEVH